MANSVSHGFLRLEHRKLLLAAESPEDLLDQMDRWEPSTVSKWLGPEDR